MPNKSHKHESDTGQEVSLKPCPFCGGKAVTDGYSSFGSNSWTDPSASVPSEGTHLCKIHCHDCNAVHPESYASSADLALQAAADKWNTRAALNPPEKEPTNG